MTSLASVSTTNTSRCRQSPASHLAASPCPRSNLPDQYRLVSGEAGLVPPAGLEPLGSEAARTRFRKPAAPNRPVNCAARCEVERVDHHQSWSGLLKDGPEPLHVTGFGQVGYPEAEEQIVSEVLGLYAFGIAYGPYAPESVSHTAPHRESRRLDLACSRRRSSISRPSPLIGRGRALPRSCPTLASPASTPYASPGCPGSRLHLDP
jgi:hypothetical protein